MRLANFVVACFVGLLLLPEICLLSYFTAGILLSSPADSPCHAESVLVVSDPPHLLRLRYTWASLMRGTDLEYFLIASDFSH